RMTTADDLKAQREEATGLVEDLRRQVAEMDARELFPIVSVYTHAYRKKDGVSLHRSGESIALDIAGKGRMPIDTPPEYLPIFRRVFEGTTTWFAIEDVIEHNEGAVPPCDVFILLQRLAEAEVLECKDER